jgi:AAA15 family ATPase/GTPase
MSHSIQITNFKAFQETGEITLTPITVLCGPNSAGKSSIIQALLMIRQSMLETQSSVPSSDERQPLILNGQLTKLGSWSNVIHGKNINDTLSISISTKGQLAEWHAHRREHNPRVFLQRGLGGEYDVRWSLSIRSLQSEQVEVSQYIDQISMERKGFCEITITKENTTDEAHPAVPG